MMLTMNHPYNFVRDGEQQQQQHPVTDADGHFINPTLRVAAAAAAATAAAAVAVTDISSVGDPKLPANISTSLHALLRTSITRPIILPPDFRPHPYSVILGRGNRVKESTGNRRLHVLVELELRNYVRAPTRKEKSLVVGRIMKTIQDASRSSYGNVSSSDHHPGSFGAFVRFDHGRWVEVDDATAREKVGTLFRDKLSHQYKSSTHQKVERRRERREAAAQRMSSSTSSSLQEHHRQQQQQEQKNDDGTVTSDHHDGNMQLDTDPSAAGPAATTGGGGANITSFAMGLPMEVEFDFELFKEMVEKDSNYSPYTDDAVDCRGAEGGSHHDHQQHGRSISSSSSSITTWSSNSSISSGPFIGGDEGDDTMMLSTFV